MKIRVPATSANLGPGFDSCGIALSLYLTVEVGNESDQWEIKHTLGEEVPHDASNLLVQSALKVWPSMPPRHLKMTSEIPLTRGLGSSSSAIVAGIELANRLGNLNLSLSQKVACATQMEGHPDNVAPAICGDFVVSCYLEEEKNQVKSVKHYFPECDLLAFIPDTELLTSESRGVLPANLPYKEAVQASAIANVMIAAIIQGNLLLAGQMMAKDRWHEKYRSKLVTNLKEIQEICTQETAYGSFLSGAGPTILILSPEEKSQVIKEKLQRLDPSARIELLAIDREGVQVF